MFKSNNQRICKRLRQFGLLKGLGMVHLSNERPFGSTIHPSNDYFFSSPDSE